MQGTLGKSREDPALAAENGVERRVVGEHRDDDFPPRCGIPGCAGEHRAGLDQRPRPGGRTVPDDQVMRGVQQICGDSRAHVVKAYESDAHVALQVGSGVCYRVRSEGCPMVPGVS